MKTSRAVHPNAAQIVEPVSHQYPASVSPLPVVPLDTPKENDSHPGVGWQGVIEPVPPPIRTQVTNQAHTFEQQFGGQAFVWLGGIALALAGFFLVKYSIDAGLLTEKVRVVLGMAFGIALLGGSHVVRQHPRMADSTRIAQALAGAGIADLYGCLFAATSLYHLVPSWLGFAGMAGVTGMTLLLSLRYGAPIAAMGLIGGFVTPLLIHGDPNTPLLFGYLYVVFGSLAVVIRRQKWWWLSIPATLITFLWVIAWLFIGLTDIDGMWLSLFLLGVSTTVVVATYDASDNDAFSLLSWLRYIAIGGSLLLMGTVTYTTHFDTFEWGMFGLFSVGAILLAWSDSRTYGFAPWLAMAANAVMLLAWESPDPTALTITLTSFGALFTASAYLLMPRSPKSVSWAGLSATSALAYYLLAYHRLDATLTTTLAAHNWLSADELWAVIAFIFTAFFTSTTNRLFVTCTDIQQRHRLQAIFTVAATGFLSLGFAILLHQDYLAFAIAGQVLTISWINRRVDIPTLRAIAQVLTVVFGLLLLPEIMTLLASPFDDFSGYAAAHIDKLHTASSLLFQFGLPSVMFAGSSWLLRSERDDQFVVVLELAAIALFTAMSYNVVGTAFSGHEARMAFVARGTFTNILFLLSLAGLHVGRQYVRPAVVWGGLVLGGLAVARSAGFDLLIYNPLWAHQMIGTWPILNGLLLVYALPVLLVVLINKELAATGRVDLSRAGKIAVFALSFVFVSLNVRQFYHGAYLDGGIVNSAEVYTYSAVWLLMGIGLLFTGTLRHDGTMRTGSLIIMLLTVGKVFLYDASELTGLWRVFSFFGLGLSLLGLSWFYSRFVFKTKK
ncbi:MAG: DUF2339 domain-containing protein [Alphaproteobacteria bacterium]|nr:DUF2339 domain-containing protein [Alphaproteobacteria bacterium]